MSYAAQHSKMEPVLKLAGQLDIATNPAPEAIFDPGSGGFNVWCTQEDHPAGWACIEMFAGTFSKPCEFVGSVTWDWADDVIIGLNIETDAYALAEQIPGEYIDDTEQTMHHDQHRSTRAIASKFTGIFLHYSASISTVLHNECPSGAG